MRLRKGSYIASHLSQRQRLLEDESVVARLRRELAILEWSIGGPAEPNARAFSLN